MACETLASKNAKYYHRLLSLSTKTTTKRPQILTYGPKAFVSDDSFFGNNAPKARSNNTDLKYQMSFTNSSKMSKELVALSFTKEISYN